MDEGWGYLFAWHKSSARSCREFMRSLATAIYEGRNGDALFRLVFSTCENLALAPVWWEKLEADKQVAICQRIDLMTSAFAPVETDYLTKGLEGISGWQFESVLTNVPGEAAETAA
jgi:hypothetical protein